MDLAKKKELVQAVLDAPSACAPFKAAAEKWMDAAGTADEAAAAAALVAEAKDDICSIDDVMGFFASETAAKIFGAEGAAAKLAHAKEIKAAGAVYCDCPGCTAAKALMDAEAEFLA